MNLHALRDPLEHTGLVFLASCADDGTPDVALVTAAHVLAADRLALSCQAFDTPYENLRRNPHAGLLLLDPDTASGFRLTLRWHHTETEGPASQAVRARLEYLAVDAPGTAGLTCTDIHEVSAIEPLQGMPATRQDHLLAVRMLGQGLAGTEDLSIALDLVLDGLRTHLAISNSLVLCMDESGQWLYTVASRGYAASGVGSEVAVGEGLIGLCARYRTPMRSHPDLHAPVLPTPVSTSDDYPADPEIPLPSLAHARCQMAVPIMAGNWLGGVLYAESAYTERFSMADEDALQAIASQLAMAMRLLLRQPEPGLGAELVQQALPPTSTDAISVKYYPANQSLFFGDDYLIKGVAGAILWLMLSDYQRDGRQDFSNRELRMDARLRLPEFDDNLETRLLLLQRRLAERCDWLRIDRPARGRLRLVVTRSLVLQQADAAN